MNKSRKMSAKLYNKLYAKRGKNYLSYCNVYYENENRIITEHKANLLGRLLLVLLYPFAFLGNFIIYGLSGIKDFNTGFVTVLLGKPFSRGSGDPRHKEYWKEMVNFIDIGELPKRKNIPKINKH